MDPLGYLRASMAEPSSGSTRARSSGLDTRSTSGRSSLLKRSGRPVPVKNRNSRSSSSASKAWGRVAVAPYPDLLQADAAQRAMPHLLCQCLHLDTEPAVHGLQCCDGHAVGRPRSGAAARRARHGRDPTADQLADAALVGFNRRAPTYEISASIASGLAPEIDVMVGGSRRSTRRVDHYACACASAAIARWSIRAIERGGTRSLPRCCAKRSSPAVLASPFSNLLSSTYSWATGSGSSAHSPPLLCLECDSRRCCYLSSRHAWSWHAHCSTEHAHTHAGMRDPARRMGMFPA
jgi:hypothetical protein